MLLFLAALLILLNGFFVAAEFALVKVRASQLEPLVEQGNPTARVARHIVRNLDPYLSATQLGITLASLGLGWVGEPAVADLLEPVFAQIGLTEPIAIHAWSTGIAFTLISFLHIVIGEVAPKTMALVKPVSTSLFVAVPMRVVYYLFYPFLVLLNASSNAVLRLFGIDAHQGHGMGVTAEELYHITASSAAEGVIEQGQGELLTNVLSFSDRVAREIMVPRGRVVYVRTTHTLQETVKVAVSSGKTRIPLIEDSLDNVVGVIHLKDLLPYLLDNKPAPKLAALARRVIFVPENMPAQKLMLEFQRQRSHFAIVVDEYGGLSGIVTMEDALEELVGEIQDEFDYEAQPILTIEGGYNIDAGLLLSDLTHLLQMRDIEADADTVGGYVMERMGRVPAVGDSVEIPGWTLRVKTMDRLRIQRIEVLAASGTQAETRD